MTAGRDCRHTWLGSTHAGWSCGGCDATVPGCDACHPLEGGSPARHTDGPDCDAMGRETTPDDPRVLSQEDGPYYAAPHRYSHAGHGRWWCPDCSVWIRNADCPRNQKWLADMAVLNG